MNRVTRLLVLGMITVSLIFAIGCNGNTTEEELSQVAQVDETIVLEERLEQDELLPIGSVVLLEGGSVKLMIVGRVQRMVGTNELFDYSSCVYPYGFVKADEMYLFNHDDIATLYHVGFINEEEAAIQERLEEEGY